MSEELVNFTAVTDMVQPVLTVVFAIVMFLLIKTAFVKSR